MLKSTRRIAIAAAGAILFAAAPAQAETIPSTVVNGAYEVLTAKVSFADLNMSSPKGRKRFDARVRAAVRRVCLVPPNLTLADTPEMQDCRQAAHASATAQAEKRIAARR